MSGGMRRLGRVCWRNWSEASLARACAALGVVACFSFRFRSGYPLAAEFFLHITT